MTVITKAENRVTPFIVSEADLDVFQDDSLGFFSPTPSSPSRSADCSSCKNEKASEMMMMVSPSSRSGGSVCPSRRSSMSSSAYSACSTSFSSLSRCPQDFFKWNDDESTTAPSSVDGDMSLDSSFQHRQGPQHCQSQRPHSFSAARHRRLKGGASKRKEGRVSFRGRIKVRSIPHLNNLSDDEVSSLWYGEQELAEIRIEAAETARRAEERAAATNTDETDCREEETSEIADDGEYTLRGLSSMLMSTRRRRHSCWIMALTCVLDEQKRQQRENRFDPYTIAKMYRAFAVGALHIAQANGRKDAEAAAQPC